MRNIEITKCLLCFCLIICFSKLNAQTRATTLSITGDGTNPQVLIAITDKLGINTIVDTVTLNAAKPVKYNVKIAAAQNVFLRYGKSPRVQLWLTPGNLLNVTLKNTPEFSGPDAIFAQYYASDTEYWKKIDAEYAQRNPGYEKERDWHSDKYFAIQDSTFIDRIKFLKSYFKQVNNKDVANFIEQQESSFYYINLYYKMTFDGSDFEKFKFIQTKYKIIKPNTYGLSDVADFNNPGLLLVSNYPTFFCTLVGYMARKRVMIPGEKFPLERYLEESMKIIDELTPNTKSRDDFKAVYFNNVAIDIRFNKDVKMADVTTKVISGLLLNGNKNLAMVKAEIEKIIAESKFAKGAPAPVFILKDPFGKTYTLNDFKGKKLIFDMSASWCGPCIAGIPDWNKFVAANSSNKGIVFVSLSLDETETEWGTFLKKHPTEGLHLYADNGMKGKFATDYQIVAIPHFLLIDQNSKIATYKAENINSDAVSTFLKQ